jgi:hypothetical protein
MSTILPMLYTQNCKEKRKTKLIPQAWSLDLVSGDPHKPISQVTVVGVSLSKHKEKAVRETSEGLPEVFCDSLTKDDGLVVSQLASPILNPGLAT